MTFIGPGFDAFNERCNQLGIAADWGEPSHDVPISVLGQPLESTLSTLYAEHDGVQWLAPEFSLIVCPLTGADALAWENESIRAFSEDHVPPYAFKELLLFAQVGRRASHLATIPALTNDKGGQPVVYLDVHENPWAVPIAESVDGAFALLAHYIDRATTSFGRAGLEEARFPFDVGDLITIGPSLRERINSGELAHLTRGDESIKEWISATFR